MEIHFNILQNTLKNGKIKYFMLYYQTRKEAKVLKFKGKIQLIIKGKWHLKMKGKSGKMILLKENNLDVDTYLYLRKTVNWKSLTYEQGKKAIDNSLYTVCAYYEDVPVGMGRIVGDGVVIDYIQDLVVNPTWQDKGIGRLIIENLISYVKKTKLDDTEIMLCLMCAKGREKFYSKFQFISRPTDTLGPGMIQYIK